MELDVLQACSFAPGNGPGTPKAFAVFIFRQRIIFGRRKGASPILTGYLAEGLPFNSTTTTSKALSPVFSGR